jgi:hypothetical protein
MGPLREITATYAIYPGPSSCMGNRLISVPAWELRGLLSMSPTQVVAALGPIGIAS